MSHGPHDNCLMCSMAKAVGMMEKHPEGCKCGEGHSKKEEEQKKESKISATLGITLANS